jgi:hypothetical protein
MICSVGAVRLTQASQTCRSLMAGMQQRIVSQIVVPVYPLLVMLLVAHGILTSLSSVVTDVTKTSVTICSFKIMV